VVPGLWTVPGDAAQTSEAEFRPGLEWHCGKWLGRRDFGRVHERIESSRLSAAGWGQSRAEMGFGLRLTVPWKRVLAGSVRKESSG